MKSPSPAEYPLPHREEYYLSLTPLALLTATSIELFRDNIMSEALSAWAHSIRVEEEPSSLRRQIARLSSIVSLLEHLGINGEEFREHLYDLLASWAASTSYTYVEGLLYLASQKRYGIEHLVDIYGENGLEVILESLEQGDCSLSNELEALEVLMDDLEVEREARLSIIKLARENGCQGARSASIALLITPPKGIRDE